jgi:hypothetical protein
MTDKMTVKACKTSKQIMVQLLQTAFHPRYISAFQQRRQLAKITNPIP